VGAVRSLTLSHAVLLKPFVPSAEYTHGEKVAFGLLTQLILEGQPQEEIQTILKFCSSVGLPISLKDVGVDATNEKAIHEIAERALAPGESAHSEPFEVTVPMLSDAIRAADRMGTLFEVGKTN
jgi:glycerol dehydrogenase